MKIEMTQREFEDVFMEKLKMYLAGFKEGGCASFSEQELLLLETFINNFKAALETE